MNLATLLPSVLEVSPTADSTGVAPRPPITVRFNLEMEASQFASGTVNQYLVLTNASNDQPVDLELISFTGKLLTVQPAEDLTAGATYLATVLGTLKSAQGRSLGRAFTWQFTVNGVALDPPDLLAPGDNTSHTLLPALAWEAVVPGTGTVTYEVALAREFGFVETLWSTETSGTLVTPGISLSEKATYYWRVRTLYGGEASAWSAIRAFYLGTDLQPSPTTRVRYPEAVPFCVVELTPEAGTTNQSDWPEIRVTFNTQVDAETVTASSVILRSRPVDDAPDRARAVLEAARTLGLQQPDPQDDSSWYHTLTVTPCGSIVSNTRYELILTRDLEDVAGNRLAEEVQTYFTSTYTPLYGGFLSTYARCGGLLGQVTEDEVNHQIYRASLRANARYAAAVGGLTESLVSGTPPSLDQVRSQAISITPALIEYVELSAAIGLLESYQYQCFQIADRRRVLADFQDQVGADLLDALAAKLKELRAELAALDATLFNRLLRPRSGVKSETWQNPGTYPTPIPRSNF